MWRELPLSDLAEITSGGTPARDVLQFWGGGIPWVTPTDISACSTNLLRSTKETISAKGLLASSAKLVPAGSILLTSRATIGEARIAGMPVCTNQGFKNLTPKQNVDGRFLFYQVQRSRSLFERYAAGSTFPEIGKGDTGRVRILHPVDLARQERIAAILAVLDRTIEKTEALIEKYEQIKAGLMQDLFTRGVLPNGQLRPSQEQVPKLYQATKIGWIPYEWSTMTLRSLVGPSGIVNGPFGSDLLTAELRDEGVPVLYVQDVKPGRFKRVSAAYVTDRKARQLAFCSVRYGDVLVAKVGSPPCDSCVYLVNEKAIVTQDVIRVRPTPEVEATYLSSILNSAFGRNAVRRISIEGTRERVSLTELKGLVLPVPPFDEQSRISCRLNAAQALIDAEVRKRDELSQRKVGLMQDLLTGKVPVETDETTAPA